MALRKKRRNDKQFDEFLKLIQLPKMKELWDNKQDDKWDKV